MTGPLTAEQVDRFIQDGFVRLESAFPRSLANEGCRLLWAKTGLDPHDPSGWTRPVVRLDGSGADPFVRAANTPRLHAAFDQLAGRGRWRPRPSLGTFPIRFPSTEDPGDAGWHIDGSYYVGQDLYVNLQSRDRALLMLFLFSDVSLDDAPTRVYVGSHLDVPPVLVAAGETGVPQESIMPLIPTVHEREVALVTGRAGDVYLCHPFLVHAASWPHRGKTPRFIAQPPLAPAAPLQVDRPDGDYSPVEIAVRLALRR